MIKDCGRARKTSEGLCATLEYRRARGLLLEAPIRDMSGKVPKGICIAPGCAKTAEIKGYCGTHYHRRRRGQDMNAPIRKITRGGARCEVSGCDKQVASRGLCGTHAYQRDSASGLVGPKRSLRNTTMEFRMAHYTSEPNENGCRLWKGGKNRSGYPQVSRPGGGSLAAHRVAYELANEVELTSIEPIHHICGVIMCVEPSHLKKVEPYENTAEMLERTWYLRRIAELEAEVVALRHMLSPDAYFEEA